MERVDLVRGDIVDNRYQIVRMLGEGTFGQVFCATDRQTGKSVALKLLKLWCVTPDERDMVVRRFDMEYSTGQIDSPYLVHSLGKGSYRGNPYIVMEFCDGGDLSHAMNEGTVNLERASIQVLQGLGALHRHGKVHRDLKPENVLIRHDGTAVLTDFGISGDRNNRLTRKGILGAPKEIMGTFIYMPPEQVRPPSGNATVLPTTDIFSFGVMLYQLVTGRLPFGPLQTEDDMERYCENGRTGRWDREALQRHFQSSIWIPVVEGCLQPNYKKRLQTVDEVLRMIPSSNGMSHKVNPRPEHPCTEWQLRVMQGEESGRVYPLNPRMARNGVLRMGRQSSSVANDVNIVENNSSFISRAHCTLEWDSAERRWYLWDGQWVAETGNGRWKPSLNGTYVGSREVTMDDAVPLADGDIIAIGDVTIRVEGIC